MSKRRNCQSFVLQLRDGTIVRGHGQFVGPITEKDRDAIESVIEALRKHTNATTIESVTLTKPDA